MTTFRRVACVLVAALAMTASGQAQPDLSALLDHAEQLLRDARVADAQPLFGRVYESAREAGRDSEAARALLGLAEISRRAGRGAEGLAQFIEAHAIYERAGDQAGIAEAAFRVGQWQPDKADAMRYFEKSVA